MTSTAQPSTRAVAETIRFGHLDIAFDHRVLRPRPWTAAQSRWAADVLRDAPEGPVLELCSGAGHIGLLAITDNHRRLVAVDADAIAVDYTLRNAAAAGLADRVEVRHATLEEALLPDEVFPVIIADPPWVPTAGIGRFPMDPPLAIDGGVDGLSLARACVEVARTHLADGGVMLLQLGDEAQVRELAAGLADRGLTVTDVRRPDPTGVVACLRAGRHVTSLALPEN